MTASIATYDELVSKVADFLNLTSADVNIPAFIRLAEAQFERRLKVRAMEKRVTYVAGSESLALPTDFLKVESFVNTDAGRRIDREPIDSLEERKSRTGNPEQFAIWGDAILVWPVPSTDVNVAMRYLARVPSLSSVNPINDVLLRHPDLYLYGTLLQAAIYLHEDEMVSTYAAAFSAAIEDANRQSRERIGQSMKMKPSGAPV